MSWFRCFFHPDHLERDWLGKFDGHDECIVVREMIPDPGRTFVAGTATRGRPEGSRPSAKSGGTAGWLGRSRVVLAAGTAWWRRPGLFAAKWHSPHQSVCALRKFREFVVRKSLRFLTHFLQTRDIRLTTDFLFPRLILGGKSIDSLRSRQGEQSWCDGI